MRCFPIFATAGVSVGRLARVTPPAGLRLDVLICASNCCPSAGNPSSSHYFGRSAKAGLERARQQVAASIGCSPGEIFFTSGGTEANNWALKGAVYASRRALQDHFTQSMGGSALAWSSMYVDQLRPHVITTAVEHPAVLEPLKWLQREQLCDISIVPVGADGVVRVQDIVDELRSQTVMVSVMHANNEIGSVQPLAQISAAVKQWAYDFGERGKMGLTSGILIHSDGCQSLGKIEVNVGDLKVDLMSIAGHKLYAPKGVGALYIKGGVAGPAATGSAFLAVDDEQEAQEIAARDNNSQDYLMQFLHGAGQESGLRASTENVALCVGLGSACEIAVASPEAERERERQAALVERCVDSCLACFQPCLAPRSAASRQRGLGAVRCLACVVVLFVIASCLARRDRMIE
jgi:cysteine sulfinate desulfinase/cysteine desulfurase-like protein